MRRFTKYIAAALLALGVFTFQFEKSAHAQQKTKQRVFYIETQADSPIMIRNLSAVILPENSRRNAPEIEVALYLENKSPKKISLYTCEGLAADGSANDDPNGGISLNLLPNELRRTTFTCPVAGKSLIYRIKSVRFEDGTEWKATPFNASKAKKSAPVTATTQQSSEAKRTLAIEWTKPMFGDRLLKSFDGADVIIEGVKIQTKFHIMKPERLADVEDCPPTPEQWAEAMKNMEEAQKRMRESNESAYFPDTEFNYDVNDFKSYSFGGRVIAYEIPYYLIEAETQTEVGVGMQNLYVDETGDGTFRLRCGEGEHELLPLPQWVKDLAVK